MTQQSFAVAIGVNRASIHFEEVLRGGYARETVVVTTDSPTPIAGEVLLFGEEQEWLNFSAKAFNFSRDNPYQLVVEIRPPPDAQILSYRVNMSILTGEISRDTGGLLGTATRASLGVPIFLQMTGTERIACQVAGVRILDTERGQPVQVVLSITNRGNVRINPEIVIEVFVKLQTRSLEEDEVAFGMQILPTVTEEKYVRFPFDLDRSQYWATIEVPMCGYKSLFSFDVLDIGETKDDAELIRIDAPPWSETGQIIPIKAIFRNKGVRSVQATFKGTITSIETKEIVKVIDTDNYIVDPGVTGELETFFNPTEPGQYEVTGKVLYNEKLTVEKGTILNVNGASLSGSWIPGAKTILLILIFIIIIALLIMIIRKRRRQNYGF